MNDSLLPPDVAERLANAGLRVVPDAEHRAIRDELEALRAGYERVRDINEFLVRGTKTACASVEVRLLTDGAVEVLAFDSADRHERLHEAIVDAVMSKIGRVSDPARLLTKRELGQQIGISTAQIDRNVRAGMPVERPGKRSPRFDLAAVRAWMRGQRDAANASAPRAPAPPPLPSNVRKLHGWNR